MIELSTPFIVDFGSKITKFGFSNSIDVHTNERRDNDIEKEFQFIFQNINPDEHSLLLTCENFEESMIQILFEAFNLPCICFKEPSILSLFHYGKVNGSILNIGHETSYFARIKDGNEIEKELIYYNGSVLDDLLYNKLNIKEKFEGFSHVKEKLFFVSQDYEKDISKTFEDTYFHNRNYEYLPNKYINVSTERFIIPVIDLQFNI